LNVETLTDKMGGVLEGLGQIFLIAGYLPSALFVLAHQVFLFPRWLDQPFAPFQTSTTDAEWSYLIDQVVTLILLPVLLGIVLMALNTIIIKLFEGSFGWQKQFVLRLWQRRNQRRAEDLYGELVVLKQDYTGLLADLSALPAGAERLQLEQKRASLALEMQRLHTEIVEQASMQRLPRRTRMVKSTALGNAFAVIEEYPYERYGMDGLLFWPRLRPLLDAPYAAALTNTKMILDLLLNLSLLACIFGVEAALVGVMSGLDWTLIGAGIGAWALAFVCYRGAVGTVHSLGDTIALCFDLYRGKLWEQFGLPPARDLEEEQATWLQLGQFLRLGEGFYHPLERTAAAKEQD
jgi:hypothetical protein